LELGREDKSQVEWNQVESSRVKLSEQTKMSTKEKVISQKYKRTKMSTNKNVNKQKCQLTKMSANKNSSYSCVVKYF
jgi:hypothetical protein